MCFKTVRLTAIRNGPMWTISASGGLAVTISITIFALITKNGGRMLLVTCRPFFS